MTAGSRVVLAIDYGLRRVGVATGNLLTRTATPLTTLRSEHGPPWPELDALVREWRPDTIVVGRPHRDERRRIETEIREFVEALAHRYAVEVESVDEAFSSAAARSALRERRRSGHLRRRIHRDRVDQHAACLIAEQWMSRH